MTLGERQELFSRMIAHLILKMYDMGYQVRVGDFWAKPRNPLEHKANSEHYEKCAGDINLMQNGKLCGEADHRQFAAYWESLHKYCRSGIRWADSNHYEIADAPVTTPFPVKP